MTTDHARRRVVEPLRRARVGLLIAYDVAALLTAYTIFALLRYEMSMGRPPWGWVLGLAAVALVVHLVLCFVLKLYRGRAAVASVDETVLLSVVTATAASTAHAVNVFGDEIRVGRTVPLAAAFMSLTLMVVGRAWWRVFSHQIGYVAAEGRDRTIVIGAGETGHRLVRSMRTSDDSPYEPVALLDDDPWKRHLRLDGVPVRGKLADLSSVAESAQAKVVIVAIATATSELLSEINERAEVAGLEVKVLPSVAEMFDDHVSIRDVRDLNMADILGRGAIDTDVDSIAHFLEGKRVLVTGAGGSIGAELSRQISKWSPAELMMLDRDESALHGVQLAIHGHGMLDTNETILADIRDAEALNAIFDERRPEVVFHAAALKHLPMLERYPAEALKTNVLGTANVLQAAARVGVDRFVNVSTDKAADPTSNLGYSKRVAERLTAEYARTEPGTFISVRFGNVLGSRGSVLTTFAAQIERGGPVTVTHPDVTRYFMTVSEAVQLVLQAGAIGRGGEVLILDMGEPVRIADVAKQLVAKSSRRVEIVYTGLRKGEKLDEILRSDTEDDNRPFHDSISHVQVPPLAADAVPAEVATVAEHEKAATLMRDLCRPERI